MSYCLRVERPDRLRFFQFSVYELRSLVDGGGGETLAVALHCEVFSNMLGNGLVIQQSDDHERLKCFERSFPER